MPIYEYRCTDCEHDLEAIQKFSDSPLTDCPACGAPKLERLLSQSSFALKGGGWYADGYGGRPQKDAAANETKSEGKAEGKTEKKSESKPEPKANDTSAPKEKASNG